MLVEIMPDFEDIKGIIDQDARNLIAVGLPDSSLKSALLIKYGAILQYAESLTEADIRGYYA